jgi:3-oxoacyl-[acyl-carrier protein] reductase
MTTRSTSDRRVALVMAGSKGLGRGCAEALARTGHAVVIGARGSEALDETVNMVKGLGVPAVGVLADVSGSEGVERLTAAALNGFGRLDVLVANAGGPPPGRFGELDDDDWRVGFDLTFMSTVRALRRCVPVMTAAGFGRVVVIGSSSVRVPLPDLVLSNAFRPALHGVIASLAPEVIADGVTVNMVAPGRIDTDRVRVTMQRSAERAGIDEAEARRRSEAGVPAGRWGTPAELGALVAFLASDEAGYITGQVIGVDGGLVNCL